jgi:hypothetical protein
MSLPLRRRRGPDWLHPGWSWTVGRAWVITALSASVTLILGAVLGALPALLAGSWRDPQTRGQTWVLIGFTVASLAAAVTAIVLHRKRRWVLRQNGTAYVIRELAGDWDRRALLDAREPRQDVLLPGVAVGDQVPGERLKPAFRSRDASSSCRSAAFSASFASATARIRHTSSRCSAITSARPGSSGTSPKHAQPELQVQPPHAEACRAELPGSSSNLRALWRH